MSDKKNVEDILSELGRKIDHLVDEAKEAGEKISEETQKRIEELKERKETLEEDFKEYSSGTNEKWINARNHLNEAADSLRKAVESMFK